MGYLLAIDQGTTGSTVMVLDDALQMLAKANREFPQHYPKPGWVEHRADEIWESILHALDAALALSGIDPNQIDAIGITNQRETTLIWDAQSQEPIYPAIVWQCRRTESICQSLKHRDLEERFRYKTGLLLDPYFSGTKIRWILDQTQSQRQAEKGLLRFGTIDTFVLSKLTQGKAWITDVSNASRTLLMNLESLDWDPELMDILQVPRALLPEIRGHGEIYGYTQNVPGLPDGIPISGMAGDQQAALFGQVCFEPGEAKSTYGTGAFLMMNTGSNIIRSKNQLLTTVGWQLNGQTTYALEGSTFIAGAVVQWLRDELQIIEKASEIEALAASVPNSNGVVLVPSFTGLGAPHWNAQARGVIWGLTRGTSKAHLARAALDGIAHQVRDVIQAMERDLGQNIQTLKVDGGASQNNLLMQIQSDFLGKTLIRPQILETTALGAALLAGLGIRKFKDLEDIRRVWKEDKVFAPTWNNDQREKALRLWQEGLKRV